MSFLFSLSRYDKNHLPIYPLTVYFFEFQEASRQKAWGRKDYAHQVWPFNQARSQGGFHLFLVSGNDSTRLTDNNNMVTLRELWWPLGGHELLKQAVNVENRMFKSVEAEGWSISRYSNRIFWRKLLYVQIYKYRNQKNKHGRRLHTGVSRVCVRALYIW